MSALRFEETPEYKRGKAGESAIARWLRSKGYQVLPVYEKIIDDGKGPRLFTASWENLVAPDMLAFKPDKVRWVEAKHKSVFTWFRKTRQWETGIDLCHYLDYLRVMELSPWPVWLLFLHSQEYTPEWPHTSPTGLFGDDLRVLQNKESHRSDKHGRSGMVYWARGTLRYLASLASVRAAAQGGKS